MLQNAGLDVRSQRVPALHAAARRARLGVRFAPDGAVRTQAEAGGVAGALGRLLAIVAVAQQDGTWTRLKACLADGCQWGFYDRSRNRSAGWGDMRICRNRQEDLPLPPEGPPLPRAPPPPAGAARLPRCVRRRRRHARSLARRAPPVNR